MRLLCVLRLKIGTTILVEDGNNVGESSVDVDIFSRFGSGDVESSTFKVGSVTPCLDVGALVSNGKVGVVEIPVLSSNEVGGISDFEITLLDISVLLNDEVEISDVNIGGTFSVRVLPDILVLSDDEVDRNVRKVSGVGLEV